MWQKRETGEQSIALKTGLIKLAKAAIKISCEQQGCLYLRRPGI